MKGNLHLAQTHPLGIGETASRLRLRLLLLRLNWNKVWRGTRPSLVTQGVEERLSIVVVIQVIMTVGEGGVAGGNTGGHPCRQLQIPTLLQTHARTQCWMLAMLRWLLLKLVVVVGSGRLGRIQLRMQWCWLEQGLRGRRCSHGQPGLCRWLAYG